MLTDHFAPTIDRSSAPDVLPVEDQEPEIEITANERSVLGPSVQKSRVGNGG